MKYLRSFNEDIHHEHELEQLKDFCENSLAYLSDDGLIISYSYLKDIVYNSTIAGTPVVHRRSIYEVELKREISSENLCAFNWVDIKDHFIPFMEMITSRYKLHGWESDGIDYVKILYLIKQGVDYKLRSRLYDYYEIINDKVNMPEFWSLSIKVEI